VAFVSCTPELLDATEAHYIATFDPPLNRQRPVAGR
jgi:hypothetical protein